MAWQKAVVVALVLVLGSLQVVARHYYAHLEEKRSKGAWIVDLWLTGVNLLLVTRLPLLKAQLLVGGLYVLVQWGSLTYTTGKLRGEGFRKTAQKDLPKTLIGLLVIFLILWGLDRFL